MRHTVEGVKERQTVHLVGDRFDDLATAMAYVYAPKSRCRID
jgi:hypothetical protein